MIVDDPVDLTLSDENVWNFTQADLAMYDLPATIDKVIEVTGQPQITYVGYSQSTFTMFYGLAEMEEDYYAERVDKFIALGPCVYYKSKY